jgi:hypothetical protein
MKNENNNASIKAAKISKWQRKSKNEETEMAKIIQENGENKSMAAKRRMKSAMANRKA